MADVDIPSHREKLKRDQLAKILSKLKDKYARVRENAAKGLGRIDNPEAVPALIHALTDEACEVRRAALRALADIGSKSAIEALMNSLFSHDAEIRSQSAHFLGATRVYRSSQRLREALRTEHSLAAKENMVEALGRLRDENSLPLLASFLHDKESGVRWGAAWSIGMIGRETKSPQAIILLRHLEKHHDSRVQHEAASALRLINPSQV